MTARRVLRDRCEARLQTLPLPHPFDARTFCTLLGDERGRPIALHGVEHLVEFTGLWVVGPTADHIFFEQDTSRLHQELIILHELSHLLLGHQPLSVTGETLPAILFPHLRRDRVLHVLRRAAYSRHEELEAELLATLILERTGGSAPPMHPPGDEARTRLVRRLAVSFVDSRE